MNAPDRRKWWALGALSLSVVAVGLDGTVLSVALPTLAGSLHASETDLQWFASGYLLVLAAAMLPAGLLGDRVGRKRVLLGALALFAVGSVACAASPTAGWFIAARVLLGVAGAAVIVMALSALTVVFTKQERPRAVGVWAAANFIALPVGPILGGWLLTHFWWGWVFVLNVPVAIIGMAAAAALLPESRSEEPPGLDLVGIVLSIAGLVGITYGAIRAGENGWGDVSVWLLVGAGLVVLGSFYMYERYLTARPGGQPLVDLALFRSRPFMWGVVLAGIGVLAMFGVLFTLPQYFQGVLGTDAMGSGVRLLPLIGGLILGAVPADRVAKLMGSKLAVALGFLVLGVGMLVGAQTQAASPSTFVALWTALVGFGMGLVLATAASGALAELSEERSGVGSAVMQALQKIGGPLGSAILGSVLAATYRANLALAGLPPSAASAVRQSVFAGDAVAQAAHSPALLSSVHTAFVVGMDHALVVSAGIAVAGMVLALAFMPHGRHRAVDDAPMADPSRATVGEVVHAGC